MTTLESSPSVALPAEIGGVRDVEFVHLQFLVARRADALARRTAPTAPERDRRLWLRAECEVFERPGAGEL